MAQRLLVVGGTGFIGSHLCRMAIHMGFQVTSLSTNKANELRKTQGIDYLEADIADSRLLKKILAEKNFNYVINLSGYIDHRAFNSGGDSVISTHFDGLRNLIQVIHTPSLVRFIQIGSSDEYGDGVAPQKETTREQPFSSYSFAKVASTHFIQMMNREQGFPGVVLRLFLVYGPGQSQERFIPQVIKGCLSGSNFDVSKGEQLRDFCYVDDIVNAILVALKANNIEGEVINIGSGKPIRIKEVIEKIHKIIGRGCPQFGAIDYRFRENMALYPDSSKGFRLLNFQPKITLDDGLARTIASLI